MPPKKRAQAWDVAAKDVPTDYWPSGRVKLRLGTTSRAEGDRRRAALNALRAWHGWDIIRAVQDRRLSLGRVAAVVRERGETGLTDLRAELEELAREAIPTLRMEAADFLAAYRRTRRPRSYKQVRSRVGIVCGLPLPDGRVLGDVRLDRLTTLDVQQALDALERADATKNALLAAVSGLYRWSIDRERVVAGTEGRAARWAENPAKGVQRRTSRPRVVIVKPRQAERLFAAAELYQAAYLSALLYLGLREDELTHTRAHLDLDMDEWEWRIQPRGPDPRCGCLDCRSEGWRPKSERGHRLIMVPDGGLRTAIRRYLDAYPVDEGFVFRNPRTGGPWYPNAFDADVKALCERAGVTYGRDVAGGITAHAFRHTCATNLLKAGVRESVIAMLLGDTVESVVRNYLHPSAADVLHAIEKGPAYI